MKNYLLRWGSRSMLTFFLASILIYTAMNLARGGALKYLFIWMSRNPPKRKQMLSICVSPMPGIEFT